METSVLCAWADGPVWQRGRHSRLASEFEGSKLVVRRGGLLQWSLVVGRDEVIFILSYWVDSKF